MNVPQDVLEHKTLMIALLGLTEDVARELGGDWHLSVAAMARALGASRTSVYGQRQRLIEALVKLAGAGPGRPPCWSSGTCPSRARIPGPSSRRSIRSRDS